MDKNILGWIIIIIISFWISLSVMVMRVRNINKKIIISIIKLLAKLFKTTEQKIRSFFHNLFLALIIGLAIFYFLNWLRTEGLRELSGQLSKFNIKIAQNFQANDLTGFINSLKPFLSLLWNIVLILGLILFAFCWGGMLLNKLERVCERNRYGDFFNTYKRGLKTTGYFLLLFLPFVLWIFMWIIGNTLDSIFFSYKEWSTYSNQYDTYHRNWIMLILGFGSIPLLIAFYFPIVKGIKRHLRENKGKELLLDEIEDLKKENEKLKEQIKIYE